MNGDTTVTVIGNLTAAPELRFTQARSRRRQLHRGLPPRHGPQPADGRGGRTGRLCSCGATCGARGAENVAESLTKGSRGYIDAGRLRQHTFETPGG